MDAPQDYAVILVNPVSGAELDISDGTNYYAWVGGLHDYPTMEAILSEGYQSEAVDVGVRPVPRQFSVRVRVNAGDDTWPVRNATHNAARDALIRFIPPRGKPIIVRLQYIGTSGSWDIPARVLQGQWQEGFPEYVFSCQSSRAYLTHTIVEDATTSLPLKSANIATSSAANPTTITTTGAHGLVSGDTVMIEGHASNPDINGEHQVTVTGTTTFTIPVHVLIAGTGGRVFIPERTITVSPQGNTDTYPQIIITPTQPKSLRWNNMREYQVQNPENKTLTGYAVAIPFDFKWHMDNGYLTGDGHDIRVIANDVMMDRWFGAFSPSVSGGWIWVELDLLPLETITVRVIFGFLHADYWVNATQGPMFDRDESTNSVWKYIGAFADPSGAPSTHSWKWAPTTAAGLGMRALQSHLPSPWAQSTQYLTAVNAAGGEVPVAANIEGYAGLALHHPLLITQVQHTGESMQDPAICKLVLRARDDVQNIQEDVWELTDDTHDALDRYTLAGAHITSVFSAPREAVTFALRSLSPHSSPAGYIGGADEAFLTISNPVVVSGNSGTGSSGLQTIYMLEMEIENLTNGNRIDLFELITKVGGVWQSVTLDLTTAAKTLTMAGENFYYALTVDPDSYGEWLRLDSGDNDIRIRDEGVEGLDFYIQWQGRRL